MNSFSSDKKNVLRQYYEDRFVARHGKKDSKQPPKASQTNDGFAEYLANSHKNNIIQSLNNGKKCLDIGCGEGNQMRLLRPYFKQVYGTDISFTALSIASDRYHSGVTSNSNIGLLQADGYLQPFKNESFDYILCSEVIEHILPEESQNLLNEISRTLKKDGRCLITTPNKWEYRRRLLDFPISVLSRLTGNSPNFIKAKLFRFYLKIFGAKCSTLKAMEKHEFSEHINVLSPKELEYQIKTAGLKLVKGDVQYLYPPILGPFYKYPFLANLIKRIEKHFKSKKSRFWIFGGLVFLCSK